MNRHLLIKYQNGNFQYKEQKLSAISQAFDNNSVLLRVIIGPICCQEAQLNDCSSILWMQEVRICLLDNLPLLP